MLSRPLASAPPMWECYVFSQPGGMTTVSVPESDLRPARVTDPLERFRIGESGSAQRYRMQNAQNGLISLGQSQVSVQPHQASVVHKVAANYPRRFTLRDEVGLGKTIEAGMALIGIARQRRRRARSGDCAAQLDSAQFNLKTKFNETFSVLNTATVNSLRDNGYAGNPFANPEYPNILCSSRWVSGRRWRDLCAEASWDMIIVDESSPRAKASGRCDYGAVQAGSRPRAG